MASVNLTSAYVGNVADTLLSLAVTGNQAVQKGSIHVEPDVQKALFIPRFNVAANQLVDVVEDPGAGNANNSMTYDERILTPSPSMFYDEFNPRKFENVWREFQPTGNLVDRVDNPKILSAIFTEVLKSVGTQIGNNIWGGDEAGAAPLDRFDGYIKIADAAAGTIEPTPAGAITQANVIDILESVVAAIPDALYDNPNMIIHMKTADFRKYQAAARALDFKGTNITDAESEMFGGFAIRHYSGMPANRILACVSTTDTDSNLWAGVDVASDDTVVKIERKNAASELFFAKMTIKWGVQIGNPEECVLYKDA